MSAHSRWLILFFGISLKCDSSILEAIFHVIDTNIWRYLPDDYSIDDPVEPLLDIINKNVNWINIVNAMDQLKFESRDGYAPYIANQPHYNRILFFEHNLNNGFYFFLQFYKGKCNVARVCINLKVAKDFLSEISLIPTMKHQLLRARQILDEFKNNMSEK